MSKILLTNTIDGAPSPWSSYVAYSAIKAILPLKKVTVWRDYANETVDLYTFTILVGDKEIGCSHEISDKQEPIEKARARVEAFRIEVIKTWAETL